MIDLQINAFDLSPLAERLTDTGGPIVGGGSFVVLDRNLYFAEDEVAHAVAVFRGAVDTLDAWAYRISLLNGSNAVPVQVLATPQNPHRPRVELKFAIADAPPLTFVLQIELIDGAGRVRETIQSAPFERVLASRPSSHQPPLPVELQVDLIGERPWPITTGVPFAEGALADVGSLILTDDAGVPVDCQMKVLAWWHPGLGQRQSVKWVLLDFVAVAPRYHLRFGLGPPPPPAWVSETSDLIEVNTGAIRFEIRKHEFAGVEHLSRLTAGLWQSVIGAARGPYICVEGFNDQGARVPAQFEARRDTRVDVSIEESGSTRVTIVARGGYVYAGGGKYWDYRSAGGAREPIPEGTSLCRFVTRITAYRGLTQIRVAHKTILTHDCGISREDLRVALRREEGDITEEEISSVLETYGDWQGEPWKNPIDVGWEYSLDQLEECFFGYDSGRKPKFYRTNPWPASSIGIHQFSPHRCALVVDTTDLLTGSLKRQIWRALSAQHSHGYALALGGGHAVTLALRDVREKYPKELSVARQADGTGLMSVHFWPKHGRDDMTQTDGHAARITAPYEPASVAGGVDFALLRSEIHRLGWAHRGRALDTRVPTSVVRQLLRYHRLATSSEYHEIQCIDDIREMLGRTAQGLSVGGDFAMFVDDESSDIPDEKMAGSARVHADTWQSDPHALATGAWNASSRVEGPLAAADAAREPAVEAAIERAIASLNRGILDSRESRGMWIYGGVHDGWIPDYPMLVEGALQVVGVPSLHRLWSASHYRHVWTSWMLYFRSGRMLFRHWARATSDHFLDANTFRFDGKSRRTGEMAHTGGVAPWGAQAQPFGHWIDPDAFRLRYCLTGDGWAKDTYSQWWAEFTSRGVMGGDFRETVNSLGAVLAYYRQTQDPSALVIFRAGAAIALQRYRIPSATVQPWFDFAGADVTHLVWHRQWLSLYYELTRDQEAARFSADWFNLAAYQNEVPLAPSAFAHSASPLPDRTSRYLAPLKRQIWDRVATVMHDPARPYDGHGIHANAVGALWLQEAPYFLQALREAGAVIEPHPQPSTPPADAGIVACAYPMRERGAMLRLYALVPDDAQTVNLRIAMRAGGHNPTDLHIVVRRFSQTMRGVLWENVALGTDALVTAQPGIPVVVQAAHHVNSGPTLYELTIGGLAVPLSAPVTSYPEAIEVWGADNLIPPDDAGRIVQDHAGLLFGRQDWYLTTTGHLAREVVLVLEASSEPGLRNTPQYALLANGEGRIVAPHRVAPRSKPFGPFDYEYRRKGPRAELFEPVGHFGKGYQLFRYAGSDQHVQVGHRILVSPTAPAHLYVAGDYGPRLRLEHGTDRLLLSMHQAHLTLICNYIETNQVPLAAIG